MPPELTHFAAFLFFLAGVVVTMAGTTADRAKGRTRCPGGSWPQPLAAILSIVPFASRRGCWYDLSGLAPPESQATPPGRVPLPGIVCPECGRKWMRWRDLRRAAPRLGTVWTGRALIGAAAAVFALPILTAPKWYTAAPTWMVCLAVTDGDGRLRPGVAGEFAQPQRVFRTWAWQRRHVARRIEPLLAHSLTPAEEDVMSRLLIALGPEARAALRGINLALQQASPFRNKPVLLHVLIRLGGTDTFDGLAAALTGKVRGMSAQAALALGRLSDARAVPLLCAALGSPSTRLQSRIISRDTTDPKVDAAAIALGMLGPMAGPALGDLRALASVQDDGRALVTRAAIAAIEGREPSLGAALGRAALTPEDSEERWALEALAYLEEDGADALPALIKLLRSPIEHERFLALATIRYLREAADPARSALEAILDEPDLELVALARRVLAGLSPETVPTR